MASTRFALEQIDTNLDESMGVREIDTRPILSPVPSRKDAGRRPLRTFGRVDLNMVEPDPEQPRQPLGGLRGFRHYVNLAKTEAKLDALLARHEFVGLSEALHQVGDRLEADAVRELFP